MMERSIVSSTKRNAHKRTLVTLKEGRKRVEELPKHRNVIPTESECAMDPKNRIRVPNAMGRGETSGWCG